MRILNMYRLSLKRAVFASLAILPFSAAHAETPAEGDEALFSQTKVSNQELDDQRGGFAFGGMEITLGADIRTFLNDELALHTVITMDELGYNRVQTVAAGLTLADADTLRNSALSNGAIRMNIGDNQVYLANQGQTAIIHGNEGALQNILINTASNITASQDVTATLDLSGYDGFAATVTADQLGRSLGDDVTRAISGAFGG
jgi:hypothetical protein